MLIITKILVVLTFLLSLSLSTSIATAQCTLVLNPLTGKLECGGGTKTVRLDNYEQSFTAQTSVALTHNAGTDNVIVQCYDASGLAIGVQSITLTSTSVATVTFAVAQTGKCVVDATGGADGDVVVNGTSSVTIETDSTARMGWDATGGTTTHGPINYCADAGSSDTYACNLSPAITAYVTGNRYTFKANTANTGAASINLNGVDPKTIKKVTGAITTDLATGDILAGQIVTVIYDGTNMQMQGMLGNVSAGVVPVAQGGTGTASTLTGLVRGDASAMTAAELSGDVTTSGSNAVTVTGLNGVSLAGLATGIVKNTTTTGAPSIAVAGDFPTLNQNTTGTAAGLAAQYIDWNSGSGGSSIANKPTLPTTVTGTIASGTAALGTAEIASAACAAAVTVVATGTATTDVITSGFNGDPTAITGYVPATAGMLVIVAYPTADNVNFKVCNNTAAPITPGAVTLNWRVVR